MEKIRSVGALVFIFEVSLLAWSVSSDCPALTCDPTKNQVLYPSSFTIFGAWNNRQYGSGESALIVAKFAAATCNLPQPVESGPRCTPQLTIGVHLSNGSTCLTIQAANSTRQAEIDYGVKFIWDYSLDSGKTPNFWVFPLNIRDGMFTASLNVLGLQIPEACSIPRRATFNTLDLIPKGNRLLSPNVSIDTQPPTIVNVYSGKPAGSYTYLDVLTIIVEFSRGVYFSEIPSKFGTAFMIANASYTIDRKSVV